jgi:predicted HicB family RNase H-like nuclease
MITEFKLRHKGYIGSIEFSSDDNVYHGKLEQITDVITYEGDRLYDLGMAFIEAVEEYIELRKEIDG